MKKVWLYARISTIDKQDLETQLLPLREYVKQRWWQEGNIYTDKISWSQEKRPWLNALMKDAFKRKFDIVLVYRFDRMSRSTKHLITTLETFRTLWIDFVSYNEAVDTSTPAGQMMFTMISWFAQFERSIIQERVKSWLDRARKQWKILWRPKLIINKHKVLSLREEGLSIRNIAKKVWVWKWTIERILKANI